MRSAPKVHHKFIEVLAGFMKSCDVLHHLVSKKADLAVVWVYPLPENVMLLHKELISIVRCPNSSCESLLQAYRLLFTFVARLISKEL